MILICRTWMNFNYTHIYCVEGSVYFLFEFILIEYIVWPPNSRFLAPSLFRWREKERDIVGAGDRLVLAQTKAAQTILFNTTSKLLKYMILFDISWLGLVR